MAVSPKAHRRPSKPFTWIPVVLTVLLLLITTQWLIQVYENSSQPLDIGIFNSNVAFATILLPSDPNETDIVEAERYFTSTRMLNYQLQYQKSTRSKVPIPFLVLTTPTVPEYQKSQLAEEGATIIPISTIPVPSWIKPGAPRWQDVMSKLRLFELTQYDRILFLDADTFLLRPMAGIFSDPFSHPIQINNTLPAIHTQNTTSNTTAKLPQTYLLASLPEVLHKTHHYPPQDWHSFNAGFFLLSPSLTLFKYYTSILHIPNIFDPTYPEQNLLNYAHREWGPMPWKRLSGRHGEWNINLPSMRDVKGGVRSVHAKLWWEGSALQRTEKELMGRWEMVRREMEGFYEKKGRESLGGGGDR